jgi:hypothetical protein
MRIRFKKGMTPENVARVFLDIIGERGFVLGSVNIYFQEYDENMKLIKFENDTEFLEVTPSEHSQKQYTEYQADLRRSKLKAV